MSRRKNILSALAVLLFAGSVHSEPIDFETCKGIEAEVKKSIPIVIDSVTKRISFECTKGWTKPFALSVKDNVESEKSASAWVEILNNPEALQIVTKLQCRPEGFGKLINLADVEYNLLINGTPVRKIKLSESVCRKI